MAKAARASKEQNTADAARSAELEPLLDGLFVEPLGEFIEARKRLAKQLESAGLGADATRVKKLKKPVVSAWVVNQLAIGNDACWDALLDAGENVRRSQAGGSASAEHREAVTGRRRALDLALARAEELLVAAGHAPTPATLQRVSRSLEAIAAYGRTGVCDPVPGRLHEDLEPPGFEVLLELAALEPRPARKKRSATPPKTTRARSGSKRTSRVEGDGEDKASDSSDLRVGARRERVKALERERSAVTKQLDQAKGQSRRAATARREAERRIGSHQKLVDKAQARLEDLQQTLVELSQKLAESTKQHRGAELAALEIEKRLARIDAELKDTQDS